MRHPIAGLLLFATAAWAGDEKDVRELSLDDLLATPIEVASKSTARATREAPGVVTAMTRDEILASGARDLLEVLQLIPGFSFQTDVEGVVGAGFRGLWGHEGKVLLIVDGIELNDLLYSTNPFGNHVPVQLIERVEVIRGPGSAVYGGNAELAVINVITRRSKDLMGVEVGGRYALGARGLADRSAALSAGWAFQNGFEVAVNLALSEGRRSQGHYSDYAGGGYDMARGSALDPAVVNLSLRWRDLSFKFLYDDYRLGAQDGYGAAASDPVTIRFRTVGADLRYRLSRWETVVPTAYLQWRLQLPWEVKDPASELFYTKTAQRLRGGLLVEWTPLDNLEVVAGVEAYGDFASLNSDQLIGTQTDFRGASSVSYANLAAYAQLSFDNPYVNVSAGGRFEWNSRVGANFAPRLALSRRIDRFHLKALASGAFRSPGIENINLSDTIAAEQTQVAEAEAGLQLSELFYVGVNAFYMRLQNPIVYGLDPVTGGERYANEGPVATAGYELELQLRGRRGFVRANYSLALPAENTVTTYQVPGHSEALLGFASHKVTLTAQWRISGGLGLGGSAVFFSEKWGYLTPGSLDAEGTPVGTLRQAPSTLGLNVWLGYENLGLKGLSLSAGVDNLLNAPILYVQPYDGGHAPLPAGARAFYLRLSYAWHADT